MPGPAKRAGYALTLPTSARSSELAAPQSPQALFIALFGGILLKNVGDSPVYVRFCRILRAQFLLLKFEFLVNSFESYIWIETLALRSAGTTIALFSSQLTRLASRGGRNRTSTRFWFIGGSVRIRGLAPAPFFISLGASWWLASSGASLPASVSSKWFSSGALSYWGPFVFKDRVHGFGNPVRCGRQPCTALVRARSQRATKERRTHPETRTDAPRPSFLLRLFNFELLTGSPNAGKTPCKKMSGRWGDRPLGRGGWRVL